MEIEVYQERHIPWVQEFNKRVAQPSGLPKFPESEVPAWLPPLQSPRLYQEYFVAVDGGAVRGGYILKRQDFFIKGKRVSIAAYQFPLSEGIVNANFVEVGISLTLDALKRQPKLFVLGMGGYAEKLPQFLKAMRWGLCEVPFYVKVVRPFPFLRKIRYLRKTLLNRILLDIAAFTGIGWLGIQVLQALKTQRFSHGRLRYEEFDAFDENADLLWERVRSEYAMIAVRDSESLNVLYPKASEKFKRIAVFEGGKYLGWAVVLDTPMSGHSHFGSMRVGSIIDGLSHPDDAAKILSVAADYLSARRVDIMVSNHSHKSYREAFEKLGFIKGPSNFLFAASKELAQLLEPFDACEDQIYFMRGDGDGPINL